MITMAYKTINLKPATYSRLVFYKHGNKSFDDILNEFMDRVSEDKFYEKVLKDHREIMKQARSGEVAKSRDLVEALKEV